jgi:PleD family two-component response regulator
MLSAADRALYAAKAAGRNRTVLAAATAAPARG